jgi:hypothetical protein
MHEWVLLKCSCQLREHLHLQIRITVTRNISDRSRKAEGGLQCPPSPFPFMGVIIFYMPNCFPPPLFFPLQF